MKDQAEKLRKVMNSKSNNNINSKATRKAKVLAVTSGKGGVGKTNFAVNLAISIKRLGYSVLILDADLGLANVEIVTGTNIEYNISDCITANKSIEDIISEGPGGIKIISGGSGFYELSIMNNNITKFIKELEKLEDNFDFIIIDTGAGVSNIVINFIIAADEIILLTTTAPTSIMDGYTVLKALTMNGYKGKLNVVVNMVKNRQEAFEAYHKLNKAANSFLNYKLKLLGYLERTDIVDNAIKKQYPFSLLNPKSQISKKINIIALEFVDSNAIDINKKEKSFTSRIKKMLFKKGGRNGH